MQMSVLLLYFLPCRSYISFHNFYRLGESANISLLFLWLYFEHTYKAFRPKLRYWDFPFSEAVDHSRTILSLSLIKWASSWHKGSIYLCFWYSRLESCILLRCKFIRVWIWAVMLVATTVIDIRSHSRIICLTSLKSSNITRCCIIVRQS